ncbi:MAG: tetratricopeptide repeat protein [Blastocatellales bacterium]|nr:tetratricopeptide repeat protein [Blastocatellales bacterium]
MNRPAEVSGPTLCSAFLLLLFCFAPALAQTPQTGAGNPNSGRSPAANTSHTVRGKVYLPSGGVPDQRIRVVLELSTGGVAGETFTDSIGNFEFRSLPGNTYRVVVPSDQQSYETTTETIEVFGSLSRTFMVNVFLRDKDAVLESRPTNHILTVADLQEVPKDAKKAYEQGLKRARESKHADAVKHFQKAVGHFPDYLHALNKLGEQYLMLNQTEDARAIFERALGISEKYPLPHINLGIILVQQKQFDEAISHFESANRIDETYPMCHLNLGLALMEKQPADLDRAEKELVRAVALGGREFSYVRLYLFNLNWRRQSLDKAAEQLEAYLKESPGAQNAPQVREKLDALKKKIAEDKVGKP